MVRAEIDLTQNNETVKKLSSNIVERDLYID